MSDFSLHKICKWSIVAFIFYVCWAKYAFGERNYILYITGLLPIAIMAFELLVTKEKLEGYFPFGVMVNLIMCIYSVATGIWIAVNQISLIDQVKTYACISLVCMAVCYVTKKEKNLRWIANVFITVSILCCLQVSIKGYYFPGYGYIMSKDNNPNSFGLVLDLGLFGLTYIDKNVKGYRRLLHVACAVLFLYFIVGCGSRKCLIGGGIICLLWMIPVAREIFSGEGRMKKAAYIIAAIGIAFFLVWYYFDFYIYTESYQRMEVLGDTSYSHGSSALRVSYYEKALEMLYESPLIGVGFQQFRYHSGNGTYSHSTYAEAIASWGIVGSLLYFIPVLIAGWRLLNIIINRKNSYTARIMFALLIMEIFLGMGQIWFYEIEHMMAMTVIFLYISMDYDIDPSTEKTIPERRYKYVKA